MDITKKHLGRWNYGGKFSSSPKYIVVHHTASMSANSTWAWFNRRDTFVSAHYTVSQSGEVLEIVPPTHVAWHAGISAWGELDKMNQYSLSIEVVSNGTIYPDVQKYEVAKLIEFLAKTYDIASKNILRHVDITQNEKTRLTNEILAPDDDTYNKSHSRKWDVGRNLFDGQSWDEYRKSVLHDPVEERVNFFADKYNIRKRGNDEQYSCFETLSILSLMDEQCTNS